MNANSLPSFKKNSTHLAQTSAATLAIAIVLIAAIVATRAAQAQTYTVLHSFTGGQDGAHPSDAPVRDAAGNLYGTAPVGGYSGGNCSPAGCGVVYKMSHNGGGWIFSPLYQFQGGSDGSNPFSLTIGPDGTLYGSTAYSYPTCSGSTCGVVFNLKPPARAPTSVFTPWTETVLYTFPDPNHPPNDGAFANGALIFDQGGNIYGTTQFGGTDNVGTVYELVKTNTGWTHNVLYNFSGAPDGDRPYDGVTFDDKGNLYGTTGSGGARNDIVCLSSGCGTVFQLTPSGSGWTEGVVYGFGNQPTDGASPRGGVIVDQYGTLYGGTSYSYNRGGTVFELTSLNGQWIFNVIYSLPGSGGSLAGPTGKLVVDGAGNLYGATAYNVFKLTPSNGGWIYTDLHDFVQSTGFYAVGNSLTLGANGNLYGTTLYGGINCPAEYYTGCGVVFEITP